MKITNNYLENLLFSCTIFLLVIFVVFVFMSIQSTDIYFVLIFIYIPLFLSVAIHNFSVNCATWIISIIFISLIIPEFFTSLPDTFPIIILIYSPLIIFAFYSKHDSLQQLPHITAGTVISLFIIYMIIFSIYLQSWQAQSTGMPISYYIKIITYYMLFLLNSSSNIVDDIKDIDSFIMILTILVPTLFVIICSMVLYLNLKVATNIINNRANFKTINLLPIYKFPAFYNIIFLFILFSFLLSYKFLETNHFLLYTFYQILFALWLGYSCCGFGWIQSYIKKQNIFVALLLVIISILLFFELIVVASFIGFFLSIVRDNKKLN